jgi:hypothetical protein
MYYLWDMAKKCLYIHTNAAQTQLQVFQTLYVCSGCDYTSFFHQIGKATFLRHFFQHANFITGKDIEGKGTLAEIGNEYQKGFLAFLRLIGSVYFKKHATCFETPTPASHFSKFVTATCTCTEQHTKWIEDIRETISYRTIFDNEMIPSTEALFYHWRRSCWVIDMWSQAEENRMSLQPINEYGWTCDDNNISVYFGKICRLCGTGLMYFLKGASV